MTRARKRPSGVEGAMSRIFEVMAPQPGTKGDTNEVCLGRMEWVGSGVHHNRVLS
jgi:hypothetical protein